MSLQIALDCAARGWAVHPVRLIDGAKRPMLGGWPTAATSDERKVKQFWRDYPDALVGVVTGHASNLYVVDVDREQAFTDSGLDLAGGREVSTQREGGRHIYFSGPLDGRPVKNTAGGGLDFRGDGGFVVCWYGPPDGTLSPLPEAVAEWARGGRRETAAEMPDVIEQGARESTLVSLAGTMRRRGAGEAGILAALRAENESRCKPPLDDADLQRIAGSVARYDPDADIPRGEELRQRLLEGKRTGEKPALADDDFGQNDFAIEAAIELADRACWRDDANEWWMASRSSRPGIWSRQRERGVLRATKDIVLARKPDATAAYVAQVTTFLKDELVIDPTRFDRSPWHLGVTGGVVNLRTGELEPPDPSMLLTRCAPVEYRASAPAPHWRQHLDRLFEHDPERIEWFQQAVGAALVGDSVAKDQVFIYILGKSGNGKGTAMRAILNTLGQDQHAVSINPRDMTGHERHLAWMHRLRGARVAIVEEMKRGPIDVAKLKTLTGADAIVANKMRQEDESWVPTHTVFMTANHPPNFNGDTIGINRRYRPLQTGESLTAAETSLDWEEHLRAESPGILAWAVEGCLIWQANGRQLPVLEGMQKMIDVHIADEDPFSEWAEECLRVGDGFTARKRMLESLNTWRAKRGLDGLRKQNEHRDFYNWLVEAGAYETRSSGVRERGFVAQVLA